MSGRAARSIAPRLAGLLLVADGVMGLLAAATFGFLTLFPPVAAVEGSPAVEQSWASQALLALLVAIVGLWSGQRALRGIHRGRFAGVAVLVVVGGVLTWSVATTGAGLPEADAAWLGVAAVHGLAALILAGWRLAAPDGTLPAGTPAPSGRG